MGFTKLTSLNERGSLDAHPRSQNDSQLWYIDLGIAFTAKKARTPSCECAEAAHGFSAHSTHCRWSGISLRKTLGPFRNFLGPGKKMETRLRKMGQMRRTRLWGNMRENAWKCGPQNPPPTLGRALHRTHRGVVSSSGGPAAVALTTAFRS